MPETRQHFIAGQITAISQQIADLEIVRVSLAEPFISTQTHAAELAEKEQIA